MSVLGERLGLRWPLRLADAVETTLRVANVLVSHVRAGRFDGLAVMDRHLYCQLALRAAKGLPRGRVLPWLLSRLPAPDAVVHLDIEPGLARRRITARGTDTETLADLAGLRDAYGSLPEYRDFLHLDASQPPADVVDSLQRIVRERIVRAEAAVAV
jgi:dTMP kinase